VNRADEGQQPAPLEEPAFGRGVGVALSERYAGRSEPVDRFRCGTASVLTDAFRTYRIGPYAQTAPLAISQGDADTTVLESDTSQLVADVRAGASDASMAWVSGSWMHREAMRALASYVRLQTFGM
jgi:hypothetical protein